MMLAAITVVCVCRYVESVTAHSKLAEDRKERSLSLSTMLYEDKVT